MAFGDYQLEIYLQGLSGVLPSGTTAGRRTGPADRSRVDSRRTPWVKRASLGSSARACPRLGALGLPLAEGLLGATAPPVPGNGRPLGLDTAFLADVRAQVVHDGLGLTVDEDLNLSRQPSRLLDLGDERREVTGLIVGHQVG